MFNYAQNLPGTTKMSSRSFQSVGNKWLWPCMYKSNNTQIVMKNCLTLLIATLLVSFGVQSQTTIAIQDFDGTTPNWSYSSDVTYFSHQGTNTSNNVYPAADGWTGDGFYGIIDFASTTNLDYTSLADNILGETDLNDEGTFASFLFTGKH